MLDDVCTSDGRFLPFFIKRKDFYFTSYRIRSNLFNERFCDRTNGDVNLLFMAAMAISVKRIRIKSTQIVFIHRPSSNVTTKFTKKPSKRMNSLLFFLADKTKPTENDANVKQ